MHPWQRRLLVEWLMNGRIPEAVDIPTGLGKTKVMALWLMARMMGIPLPRRLVYVVDRRAIVDQASAEAETLAAALGSLLINEDIEREQRERWRANLGIAANSTIAISTLRGQFIDNHKWLERPHAAAIIVGTVDMIGSRLLFSGYGVSAGMRPVHAGLLGCDSLMVLDEAHLVPPFEALLREIAKCIDCERVGVAEIIPAFRLMTLSATGRGLDGLKVFGLDIEDERSVLTMERLTAEKKLRLLPSVESKELAEMLAARAWVLAENTRRVIVFCNSRKIAQEVESILADRVKHEFGKDARLTELFVGERRVRERTLLYGTDDAPDVAALLSRFLPAQEAHDYTQPAFLVATSAAEVGIDLDADELVCDLVSWERMVQRFGRVNRRPAPGRARIEVIPSVSEKDAEDEVAQQRLAQLRAPFESAAWPEDETGMRDASPLALRKLTDHANLAALIRKAESPRPLHPALTQPLLDAWAMTTLREHSGRPNVEPWLRGWVEKRPQSRMVWRKRFPLRPDFASDLNTAQSDMSAFLEAAPPHLTEILEAPTDRIVEILEKRTSALIDAGGDVPENAPGPEAIVVAIGRAGQVDIWPLTRIQKTKSKWLERYWAEKTIVVDSRLGGLDHTGLLDPRSAVAPTTIDEDAKEWKLSLESTTQWRIRWGRPAASGKNWRRHGFRWTESPDAEESNELWVEVWRGEGATSGDPAVAKKAQVLAEHHEWTRCDAEEIASGIRLSSQRTLLAAAAGFHDTGKNRDLWQNAMNAAGEGRPFAKTTGGAAPRSLAGYRHEFGSLGDAKHHSAIQTLAEDDRELALHLIASHHGNARPSIYAFDPSVAPSVSATLAQDAAMRYVRLQRTWGHWGLAWWESLLRASDWAASRRANTDD